MAPLLELVLGKLIDPVLLAAGRGVDRLFRPHWLPIQYDREPITRNWIAEYKGCRAVGPTRAEASRRVMVMVAAKEGGT